MVGVGPGRRTTFSIQWGPAMANGAAYSGVVYSGTDCVGARGGAARIAPILVARKRGRIPLFIVGDIDRVESGGI